VVTSVAVFPVNVLYAKQTGFITDTNCVLCEVWEEATETVKHQAQADNITPIKEVTEYHTNIWPKQQMSVQHILQQNVYPVRYIRKL